MSRLVSGRIWILDVTVITTYLSTAKFDRAATGALRQASQLPRFTHPTLYNNTLRYHYHYSHSLLDRELIIIIMSTSPAS